MSQGLTVASPNGPPQAALIGLSPAGAITRWDACAEAMTGFAEREMLGRDLADLLVAPAPDLAAAALKASSAPIPALARRKNGDFFEAEISASIEAGEDGAFPAAILLRDTREERRSRRAARHAGERLRLALFAAAIGTYEIDLLTQFYDLDARAAEIWGRNPDDPVCYEALAGQVLGEDRPAAEATLIDSGRPGGDGAYATCFRIRRKNDGALRWIDLRGRTFFEDGRPVSRVGVVLDITERKEAEDADAHLAAIVASTDDALYSLTLDGLVLSWNPAAERLFGRSKDEMIGRSDAALVGAEERAEADAMFEAARAGARARRETRRLRRDGEPFDVLLTVAPMRDRAGAPTAISVLARDISNEANARFEQESVNARLAYQAAKVDAIFEALNLPVTVFDKNGAIGRVNAPARAAWGLAPDCAEPIPFSEAAAHLRVVGADGEPINAAALVARDALAGEAAAGRRFQIESRDGAKREFEAAEAPLRVNGEVVGAVAVWHDVTEARRRDEQTTLLLRELSHRSKNLLSVIESILRQSAKGGGTKEEFVARFSDRLRALASSHDLLAKTNTLSVSMTDLIFSQLGHHWEPDQRRIVLSGLGVRLKPDAAQMIGMALHELSTNAAKYGALSTPGGRVALSWRIEPNDPQEPDFVLVWTESGGPPVSAPKRTGFGSTVIQRVAGQTLRGVARIDYLPSGVAWSLRAPQSFVIDKDAQEPPQHEPARSPALGRLENAWTALRRDGHPPRLDELSIEDIEPQDHIIVADIDHEADPPAVRFVAVGKAVTARMGLTAESQETNSPCAALLSAEDAAYGRCIRSAKPAYDYAYFTLGPERSFFFERLLLPLSDDSQRIARIVGLASFRDFAPLRR